MTRGRPDGSKLVEHVTLGLVDGEIDNLLQPDRFAVDGDSGRGVNPGAELADDLAVHGDPPLEDQLLAAATRAQPRLRQDLLDPLRPAQVAAG